MIRLKAAIVTSLSLLMFTPALRAQLSTVVVVDFERAVVESKEGKKSSAKFNAALQAKQAEIEKKQKDIEDSQKKLQNGDRTLSDAAKANLQKDIERKTTELQRVNEDAQKELQVMREELLRPIADRATQILNALAAAEGYTLVIDSSDQNSNIVFVNKRNDITEELVKRIDASTPADTKTETTKPAAAPSSTPATGRPATTTPPPRPATPPSTTAPKNP